MAADEDDDQGTLGLGFLFGNVGQGDDAAGADELLLDQVRTNSPLIVASVEEFSLALSLYAHRTPSVSWPTSPSNRRACSTSVLGRRTLARLRKAMITTRTTTRLGNRMRARWTLWTRTS